MKTWKLHFDYSWHFFIVSDSNPRERSFMRLKTVYFENGFQENFWDTTLVFSCGQLKHNILKTLIHFSTSCVTYIPMRYRCNNRLGTCVCAADVRCAISAKPSFTLLRPLHTPSELPKSVACRKSSFSSESQQNFPFWIQGLGQTVFHCDLCKVRGRVCCILLQLLNSRI